MKWFEIIEFLRKGEFKPKNKEMIFHHGIIYGLDFPQAGYIISSATQDQTTYVALLYNPEKRKNLPLKELFKTEPDGCDLIRFSTTDPEQALWFINQHCNITPITKQTTMKPTIGRIVLYKLTEEDAKQINRRRTHSQSIADRIKEDKWPIGAQAHIGNEVQAGHEVPMIVIRPWSATCINGQALLDGNDTLWVTSALQGDLEGNWQWPKRED